jgi:hypothetical protein
VNAGVVSSMVFIFVVVVAFDAAGDGLEVFVTFSVHPATNTVANALVTINRINNCFFIVIPLFQLFMLSPRAACYKECPSL